LALTGQGRAGNGTGAGSNNVMERDSESDDVEQGKGSETTGPFTVLLLGQFGYVGATPLLGVLQEVTGCGLAWWLVGWRVAGERTGRGRRA
jgi:hypothetical protein